MNPTFNGSNRAEDPSPREPWLSLHSPWLARLALLLLAATLFEVNLPAAGLGVLKQVINVSRPNSTTFRVGETGQVAIFIINLTPDPLPPATAGIIRLTNVYDVIRHNPPGPGTITNTLLRPPTTTNLSRAYDTTKPPIVGVGLQAPGSFVTLFNDVMTGAPLIFVVSNLDRVRLSNDVYVAGLDVNSLQFLLTFPNQIVMTPPPAICVSKTCDGVDQFGFVSYSGCVTNCGFERLTNVLVFEVVGGLTNRTFGPMILDPGQSACFSGSYHANDPCATNLTDFLYAQGTETNNTPITATNVASATCFRSITNALVVTKMCPPGSTSRGGTLVFSGTVSNAGSIPLTNIVIVNDRPVSNTFVTNFLRLDPGAVASFAGSYIVPNNFTDPMILDTLTATARSICGVTVTGTTNALCPITLCTNSQVICAPDKIVECGSPIVFTPPVITGSPAVTIVLQVPDLVVTNGTCPNNLTTTRRWRITDSCSNVFMCSQAITVVDTLPPSITCGNSQLIECGNPFSFTPPFAVDICNGSNVVVQILSTVTNAANPRCPGLTNIIRTWSASDACGNSNICSQTVTLVDTTPPTITCANNQIVECGNPLTFTPPFAVDACDGTNVTVRILSTVTTAVSPRCPGLTNVVRTWSASDTCGNSNVCSQTITLVDTVPPTITCANNQIVECGHPVSFTPPFAVDTCDGTNVVIRILSTVSSQVNPRCPGLTNMVRTWSASDSCGNSNVCSQTITLVDTTPPTITCAENKVVECGNPFTFTPPFAVDACDGTNVIVRILSTVTTAASPRCPGLTNVTRTWSASDSCGNSNVCSQSITLVDTVPPTITCAGNQIVECGNPIAFTLPFAVDACDGSNVVISVLSTVSSAASPRCPGLTNLVRTWSATDSCGNSNVCSQTITLVDTVPPTITCANNQIVECGNPVTFTPPFAVDTCDGTNVVIRILSTVTSAASPRCPGLTNLVRTWSATDSCGNSNVCSQTITLVDTTPPTIACANNQLVECGHPIAFTPPFAVDTCDGTNVVIRILSTVTTAASPRCPGLTNLVRTWSASDSCGNSNVCSQTITLVDTTPPTVTCANNQIVECGNPFTFTPPFAVDACDGTNVVIQILSTVTTATSPRCPGLTNLVRTWSASDSCGNSNVCSQTITLVDTLPPSITCVGNQIVECGNPVAFTPPFAVDACDGTNVIINVLSTVSSAASPRCPGLTNLVRTWSVSDTCGNSNVCSQTITLVDTVPPTITCANNQIVECGNPIAFTPPFAVDTCDGTNVVIRILSTVSTAASPRCPGLTNLVRTWSATDSCGNSNVCSQTITLVDTVPPTITCANNQLVECGHPVTFTPPFAVDTCDGTNVVIRILSTVTTAASPRCPGLTNLVRTWSASDSCGNSNVCSQTITLVDTTPPTVTCANNQIVECGNPFTFTPPFAVDACDGTNVVIQILSTVTTATSPRCPGLTNLVRTWSASDSCGNSNVCSQTITLVDTLPPSITCVGNQIVECGNPVAFTPPFAVDACDGTNVIINVLSTVSSAASPRCPGLTNLVRTWSVSDTCGNSNVCSQTITLVDTVPPTITCANNQIVECGNPIAFTPPFAVDTCDGTNVVIRILSTVSTAASPRCPALTNLVRTWSATDSCGNSNVCSQTITLVDTVPPTITCANNQLVECGHPVTFTPPFAVDTCDGTNVVIRILSTVTTAASPRCPGLTNLVRTWSASDSCGNSNVCSQTITLVDTTPPNIACGADRIVECGTSFALTAPFAVDACDGTNVLIHLISTVTNAAAQRCPERYTVRQTWSATDTCGNSNICNQTVTVVDTTPPSITCANNQIVECGNPIAFTPPFAVDACDGSNVVISVLSTVSSAASPRCPGLTNLVRTWSATDSCGNSNVCSQTITLVDTVPPTITCANNQLVECGLPVSFTPPFAVDTCDGTNVVIRILSTVTTEASPRCPGLTNLVRTWSASDSCGNSNVCSQTITLVDTTPPNIACGADRIVECGTSFALTAPFAVDACDGTNVAIRLISTVTNAASQRCPERYTVRQTWSATDTCGNSNICNQTVTVVDTTPPNITCANSFFVECGTSWMFNRPNAVDLCDGTNVVISIISTTTNITNPRCPGLYTATRVWNATDSCTNVSTCSQTITLVDTTPPNLTCAADQIVECGSTWDFLRPSALDICDGTNVVIAITSTVTNQITPRCPGLLTATRTWSAIDTCTNVSFCSQTITLVDTTPPNITCVDNQIVECGNPFAFLPPFAVDACDGTNVVIRILSTVTSASNPRCPGLTNLVRIWSASDTCGNSNVCSQTITLVDTTPPNITCAGNQIVECGHPVAFTAPYAVDTCDGTNVVIAILSTVTTPVNPRCPGLTNLVRTWSVSDTCGNSNVCTQTITLIDTTPPNISCADDQIVECGTPFAFTQPFAVDACDGTNVVIRLVGTVTNAAAQRCPEQYTVRRTWSASDTCGNSNLCSQTITVVDTTPPNLTCANSFFVECGTVWMFTPPNAVDLCDGTNLSLTIASTVTNVVDPHCPGLFTATRTWNATDSCSNKSSCSQTITIVDTTPPNLTCADNQILECGSSWAFLPPSALDICDGTNVTITLISTVTNLPNPRCPALISATRTWRATDACTNISFCSQTITLVDTTPPNVTCGNNLVLECGIPFNFSAPTAVDSCDTGPLTVRIVSTATNSSGFCGRSFSVTRIWEALDQCTNRSSCSQTFTLVDTAPPNLVCGGNVIVECGTPWSFSAPSANDVCDGTNVTVRVVSTLTNTSGFCGQSFSATRIWEAIDACTNRSTCSQTFTVVDTAPPTFNCAGNLIVECGMPWMFTRPTATDVCDGTNVVIALLSTVTNVTNPRCPGLISATRTWSATDRCTNISYCSQTVTTVDTTPPNITCADDQIVECGHPFAFTRPTAIDICDGTNVVIELTSTTTNAAVPRCPGMFTVRRTWRAVDTCSNETFCSQTITVVDTTPPTITCAGSLILECGTPWTFTGPTAVDVCDGSNVIIAVLGTVTNVASPRCPNLLSATRTWSASDTCGNSNVCSQTVTLVDTMPPNITCDDNRFVECGNPWSFAQPAAVDICNGTNITLTIVGTVTNVAGPSCPTLLSVTRTWRATDSCANDSFCSQTITLVDTRPPQLTCAEDQIVECGFPWDFDAPSAIDLCDGANVNIIVVGTVTNTAACPGKFSVVRTWRAYDSCSNSMTCRQTVLVMDTRPPILTCAPDFTLECGIPWTFEPPQVWDLCDGTNVPIREVSTTSSRICGNTFSATRTWEAVDLCGNRTTCRQTVITEDTLPPHITCHNQLVPCGEVLTENPPTASDFCDGTNVTVTLVSTVTNSGVILRTWMAMDSCWNSSTCVEQITLLSCTNCISVEKLVACLLPDGNCGPFGKTATGYASGTNLPAFCYSITVNNCGPFALTNVTVLDDKLGNLTSFFFASPTDTLAPNVPITRYFQKAWGNDTVNTVTVSGTSVQDRSRVSATNNATAYVDTASITCLSYVYSADDQDGVRGDGRVRLPQDGLAHSVTFTNIICNNGQADLAGLVASAPGLTALGCGLNFPTTLAVGACYTNVCTVNMTCPQEQGTYPMTVTARVDTSANQCGYDLRGSNITVRTVCESSVSCTNQPPAAIGDYVWNDLNTNGVQNAGEPGISNVVVRLMDCAGSVLAVTNTDVNGFYLFTGLTPGNYKVMFGQPTGFVFTGQDQGANDALDSDANPTTGMTACYTLIGGETNRTVDAGLYIPNPCLPVYAAPFTALHYNLDACIPDSSFNELTPAVTVGCLGGASGSVFSSLTGSHSCNPGSSGVGFCSESSTNATFSTSVYDKAFQFSATLSPSSGGYAKLSSLKFYQRSSVVALFQNGTTANNNRLSKLAVRIKDGATVVFERTDLTVPTNWTQVTIDLSGANLSTNVQKQYVVQLAAYSPIKNGSATKYIYDVDEVKLNVSCGTVDPSCLPPVCPPATFDLTGNTATSGTAGNIRPFSASGITVRVSAFSRTTAGVWSTAYLGSYTHGLGVTDNSEGDGSSDRHVVDNVGGQYNYVLFEFNQPVVVNRAYLDYVISDSDITVWIGNFPNPFNNHLTLSDALLGSFALTEDSAAAGPGSRWAMFNGGQLSANTLVIAAKPAGSLDDQFKIRMLDICTPPEPCAPALRLTTACVGATAQGQPISFSGSVSNTGNTTITNIAITHSIAGVVKTVASLAAGAVTSYSGSFTPANCGSYTATVTAAGKAACNGNSVNSSASSSCSVPCPPACPPATFNLTGNSATTGSAGNVRTFSAGGVKVRVSAFSRTTSGSWATAYLGSYSSGLGVTDGSEGDGSNDRHVVDNVGRFNYVLFEFSQPIVVNRAYLDYVIADSDITVWLGNFSDPFNNHLTLSDSLLTSFARTEDSLGSGPDSRWATFNGSEFSGNTLVIAAKPSGSLDDQFKISKVDICAPPQPCPPSTFDLSGNSASSGAAGNTRTFNAGGVSVRASAFSRTSAGAWATAYLGSYSSGLGVTDSSEGDGSNNRHTVDNIDRLNYVLFEFSRSVVVSRAFLEFVVNDSDLSIWIGTANNPFANHLTLSDTLLNGLALSEENFTENAAARWASFNGGDVSGNVLVLAALVSDASPEDSFKISKLEICGSQALRPIVGESWSPTVAIAVAPDDNSESGTAGEVGRSPSVKRISLSFETQTDIDYVVEYSSDISGGWESLQEVHGTGARAIILDNAGGPARFYRVTAKPSGAVPSGE